MKSVHAKARKMMEKINMNTKGQAVQLTVNTIIALVVAVLVVFGLIFGIATLNPSSFFDGTQPASANAVLALQDNTTQMVSNFSQRIPTAGTILGVVLILGAILLIVVFAVRFRSAAGGGAGGSL